MVVRHLRYFEADSGVIAELGWTAWLKVILLDWLKLVEIDTKKVKSCHFLDRREVYGGFIGAVAKAQNDANSAFQTSLGLCCQNVYPLLCEVNLSHTENVACSNTVSLPQVPCPLSCCGLCSKWN